MEPARKRHIKLNSEEIEYMNLLVNAANTVPKDCFADGNTVVFLVESSKIGAVIGKEGKNAKRLSKILNKNVEIFEYGENAEKFLRNVFRKKNITKISEEKDSIELHLSASDKASVLHNSAKLRRLKKALERNYGVKNFRIR